MEYSDQVVRVISEAIAAAMKKAMSDTSRAIEEKLRNYKFSGDNIKQMSIGNTHILPQSIDNIHIKDASIDVAKVKDFMAEVANIAVANIKSATIDTAQIRDLAAYTANIANANIKNATIKYAQIEGLTAGSALIQEAVGDKVMIADLAVVEANMVNLTLGSLVLKGEDGCFYSILVGEDGQVKTELKQIVNNDIKDLSLNAGEKLIEGSITAACLNVKEIFANKALIGAIKTANLDAAEITANKAFIEQLATSLIEAPEGTGLKLASQEFVSLHVPGELKNASVTIDKDGVAIVGGKITMNANTAIDILSGGTLNVNGGSVSVGANGSIALASGGTISVGSGSSIKINSGAAFDISSGSINMSSGAMTLSGSTVQLSSSTLSLKSDGKINIESGGTLNVVSGGAVNITGGAIALTSSATLGITGSTVNINSGSSLNVVSGGSMKVSGGTLSLESSAAMNIVSGTLSVQSGSSVSVNTGGTFTIGSGNFSIDASGNVTMTGKVTASSGKIGGWNIDTDRLYAGSGASYVALNTNASYPAIWAGNGTYSSAPFRVYQDGSVYIKSLYVLNEAGTSESKVDLRSSYWKMDSAYSHAVKTLSVTNGVLTIELYNGTSVNFNKADLSKVSVGTSGGGSVYPIDAGGKSVGIGKTVYIPINGVNSLTYNADTKKIGATCDIYLGDGVRIKQETIGVDATSAYDAGYEAGQKSMGLIPDGNTISVGVSDTKSVTATLSDNHRVGHDGRVTLTPGTMFTGTAGAYYLNAKLLGSSSISWS